MEVTDEAESSVEGDGGDNKEPQETNELLVLDPLALELDLNHGKIEKLENLECLTQIEGLYLRWNLIKKIENIQTLVTLRELEFYDNQLTVIENLDTLVNLE